MTEINKASQQSLQRILDKIGVKSTGLNPEVSEYRKLKLAVEKLKSASIDKCTSAEVMRTP